MIIGLLALQGDFALHHAALGRLGVESRDVRVPDELAPLSGLIIPGGESTTMTKLLTDDLRRALNDFAKTMPVWGTCAGMIMISQTLTDARVKPFGWMNLQVDRNGFGRQVHSFEEPIKLAPELGGGEPLNGIFIRAPRVLSYGSDCKPLAWLAQEVVALQSGNFLATSFHPELAGDDRMHRYFCSLCR